MTLSEESVLLAKNWTTFQDMLQAEKLLNDELARVLLSTRAQLEASPWWTDEWVFDIYDNAQVYIANQRWLTDDDYYGVWIGCQDFRPANIFGLAAAPSLYVWVPERRYDLAKAIGERIEPAEMRGTLDTSTRNGFVVKEALPKCLPEEVEGYPDTAHRQIIDFFSHYAPILLGLDDLIQSHLNPQS